ncbi:MAG: ribokinase, partial [Rhodospirillaceae bacterium]|nr:ribokinase [Rhodospirillaceae bacterium]
MGKVAILGIFVADLAFRAPRPPAMGETIIGSDFRMGPGGKGSNQAVAAARAGADVTFISRLGRDSFGEIALATWKAENINTGKVALSSDLSTGAAYIFVQEQTGANCIIVVPGAAGAISVADVENAAAEIRAAKVFVTQLEQPIAAARRGLELARAAGAMTVFNPAPAAPLPDALYGLCDYITPNETEASTLTGIEVTNLDSARAAADQLLQRGVKVALVTLGEAGALYHSAQESVLVPAFSAGKVVETTGAGDAFNGG